MANARGKAIDKTYLSIDSAEDRGFLHRDYIAHCLRWTHVAKWLMLQSRYRTSRILDVGPGKELPLAKLMHSSRMAPAWYGAVDVAPLTTPEQFRNAKWKPSALFGKTDICDIEPDDLDTIPNVVVCFEVLEHVEPDHCRRILGKIGELLDANGDVFLSTPCWDPNMGAAANHVNEMTYQAFGAALEDSGFRIEGHWGTFASIKDYKDDLSTEHLATFDALRGYYDTNYLATIFAPLYPHLARNCLWHLKYNPSLTTRLFPSLRDVEGTWGSSENWEQLQP